MRIILLMNFQVSNICQIMLKLYQLIFQTEVCILQYFITMEVSSDHQLHYVGASFKNLHWQHHSH